MNGEKETEKQGNEARPLENGLRQGTTTVLAALRSPFAWIRRRPLRRMLLLAVLGYAVLVGRYFFWPPVWLLAGVDPENTSFMEFREEQRQKATALGKTPAKQPQEVLIRLTPLQRISPHLRRAVVIAEDSAFWDHGGFDFAAIRQALKKNMNRQRFAAGGSTITQQLAKNLWFTPEKSITRKLQESIMTLRLEWSLSKERVLELYLNVAEWGDGVFGAENAARRWFNTSASNLSPYQAAVLAAMLPSPLTRTPASKAVQSKARIILSRMERGW